MDHRHRAENAEKGPEHEVEHLPDGRRAAEVQACEGVGFHAKYATKRYSNNRTFFAHVSQTTKVRDKFRDSKRPPETHSNH